MEAVNDNIQIRIRQTTSSNTIILDVESTITIHHLKVRIQDTEGIPPKYQQLVFAGKNLKNYISLREYGIKNGDQLNLSFLLRGGDGMCYTVAGTEMCVLIGWILAIMILLSSVNKNAMSCCVAEVYYNDLDWASDDTWDKISYQWDEKTCGYETIIDSGIEQQYVSIDISFGCSHQCESESVHTAAISKNWNNNILDWSIANFVFQVIECTPFIGGWIKFIFDMIWLGAGGPQAWISTQDGCHIAVMSFMYYDDDLNKLDVILLVFDILILIMNCIGCVQMCAA